MLQLNLQQFCRRQITASHTTCHKFSQQVTEFNWGLTLGLATGCSSADIAAACSAIQASSRLSVLKLGPPASSGNQQASQGLGWEQQACSALQRLLQQSPALKLLELWGLDGPQLGELQEVWASARSVEAHTMPLEGGGMRLAVHAR